MKKISILIALALIVTIGGVYATWSYNQSTTNTIEEHLTANMQDYVGSSANGHIEIWEKTVDIRVTDNLKDGQAVADGDAGDFIAEVEITGHLVILFTPFDEAESNNISLQYVVGTTNTIQYNETDIFTVDTAAKDCDALTVITEDNIDDINALLTAEKQLDSSAYGKSYVVIDADDLKSVISMNGEIKLDTLIKYHQFQEGLGMGNFKVTVSEKITQASGT